MNKKILDSFFKLKKSKKVNGIEQMIYGQFENGVECFYEYNDTGEMVCFKNSKGYEGFYDRRKNGFKQISKEEFNKIYIRENEYWKEKNPVN